jgi:hypothetical protein
MILFYYRFLHYYDKFKENLTLFILEADPVTQ